MGYCLDCQIVEPNLRTGNMEIGDNDHSKSDSEHLMLASSSTGVVQ